MGTAAVTAAPPSIRAQALDLIVRHTGPICIDRKLADARDAEVCATIICGLEAAFSVELDDFWRAASVAELASQVEAQVEFRAMSHAAALSTRAVDLAVERARRAPVAPQPVRQAVQARNARLASRYRRRRALAEALISCAVMLAAIPALLIGVATLLDRLP